MSDITRVGQWLAESRRVLVGAAAGLSVAAGIDYTDEEEFAPHFPALVRRGLHARYQLIGYSGLSEAAFWGDGVAICDESGDETSTGLAQDACQLVRRR